MEKVCSERLRTESVDSYESVFIGVMKQKFSRSCEKSVFNEVMKTEIQLTMWKKCVHWRYENRNSINDVEKVSLLAL